MLEKTQHNLFQIYTGWKVNEQIARVLQKMLLSLSKLQSLQWVMSWCTLVTGLQLSLFCSCLFVCLILSSVLQVLAGGTDRSNGNLPYEHNITVLQPEVSGFCCQPHCETLFCRRKCCRAADIITPQYVEHYQSNTEKVTDASPPLCFMLELWNWRGTLFQSGATTFFSLKTACESPSSYISHIVVQNLFKINICIHKHK